MDLGNQSRARDSKKRRTHAFHDFGHVPDDPTERQELPNFSPNVASDFPSQFLGGAHQRIPQQSTAQFPLPAAPEFSPSQAADPASFHYRGNPTAKTGGGVDPVSIPSVPYARDAANALYRTTIYNTMEQHLPPDACAEFLAQDQGNASPRFCRLTLNSVPSAAGVLSETSLPMGLIIQPLARQKPEEEPIPVLDFGDTGPPRCRRCRAYINPFVVWGSGGGKFRCNMCSFDNNEISPEYYAPLDMSGRYVDQDQRLELTRGTVEFVVPKEYWVKKDGLENADGGTPMRWLFLVDVTRNAIIQGAAEAVAGGIKEALYGDSAYEPLREGEQSEDGKEDMKIRLPRGCKVGICTFDTTIHFFNLNVSAVLMTVGSILTYGTASLRTSPDDRRIGHR